MEYNGIDVVTAMKYEDLFHMTDGQRFHAYPRGVHERWNEIASRPELDLTADRNLMFVYLMPYYLFVTPRRPELAEHIQQGLLLAMDDGSFDAIFMSNSMVKKVFEKASLGSRRIYKLANPELAPQIPLDDPGYKQCLTQGLQSTSIRRWGVTQHTLDAEYYYVGFNQPNLQCTPIDTRVGER